MTSRSFLGLSIILAVVGLWSAVMIIPVEWPLNAYQNEKAAFRLGPVSADVKPGQTFTAAESFDVLAAPVRIGGPFGSVAVLNARIRLDEPGGPSVVVSQPVSAASTQREFEMMLFRFPRTLPAGDEYFVEFDIPRGTRWPVFLAAISGDKDPNGRLFMRGVPAPAGQDLVYQLLRRQSIGGRLPTWWRANQGAVVVGVGLVAIMHLVSFAAICGMPPRARCRLPNVFVLGLAPPALLAAAYFALLFFVL